MLLGLSGAFGTGKTTVSLLLQKRYWIRTRFAAPLKRMCAIAGMSPKQYDGTIADKEEPFFLHIKPATAAKMVAVLTGHQDAQRRKLVDPLLGITPDWAEEILLDILNTPGPTTPRRVMQLLGTEFGRNISPTLWVDLWKREIIPLVIEGAKVVVDDVRFDNEYHAIANLGGFVIRMESPDQERKDDASTHASEQGCPCHYVLYNSKNSLAELEKSLSALLEKIGVDHA